MIYFSYLQEKIKLKFEATYEVKKENKLEKKIAFLLESFEGAECNEVD